MHARVGMSRTELVGQLGEPSAVLMAGVWAYWDFERPGRPTDARGDALIVVFAGDRVTRLRFTTRLAAESALRQVRDRVSRPATVAQR